MATITTVSEPKRGCGYRKGGGIYFRSDGAAMDCGRLPMELTTCPCCGEGVKFSRAPQWITGMLLQSSVCTNEQPCNCPLSKIYPGERYLLLWVGEKFYPTPEHFTRESREHGISRRIKSIPKGFEHGKTRIFLGHIKAVATPDPDNPGKMLYSRGVFASFVPSRIEYVIKGDETSEELDRMEKNGLKIVNVVPQGGAVPAANEEEE